MKAIQKTKSLTIANVWHFFLMKTDIALQNDLALYDYYRPTINIPRPSQFLCDYLRSAMNRYCHWRLLNPDSERTISVSQFECAN